MAVGCVLPAPNCIHATGPSLSGTDGSTSHLASPMLMCVSMRVCTGMHARVEALVPSTRGSHGIPLPFPWSDGLDIILPWVAFRSDEAPVCSKSDLPIVFFFFFF